VVAFHLVVRDEKILEKLATHDIQDAIELFRIVLLVAKAAAQ
jgi:hypothetical protein